MGTGRGGGAEVPLGRVILLNGASSSGKSTLARMLQDLLPEPFLHLSSDQLVDGGALPRRRESGGPFAWVGSRRPRFFDGFHRSIRAFVDAGNDVVVDHVIEYAAWREDLATLLEPVDVFLVDVTCDPGELDRRERVRGDRTIGEARSHVEDLRVHEFGPTDLVVDITAGVDERVARRLLEAWSGRPRRRGLPPIDRVLIAGSQSPQV